MSEIQGRRGRPKLPEAARKRNNVTIRLRDELKQQLENRARSDGRSLSEEIEFRLERSMQDEDQRYTDFGGETEYRLCRMFADIANALQRECVLGEDAYRRMGLSLDAIFGPTWTTDRKLFFFALHAWEKVAYEVIGRITDIDGNVRKDQEDRFRRWENQFSVSLESAAVDWVGEVVKRVGINDIFEDR